MFRIYMIRNEENGKCYVGATNKFFGARITQHMKLARRSKSSKLGSLTEGLKLFGESAFTANVVEHIEKHEIVAEREIYWVELNKCTFPLGYNNALRLIRKSGIIVLIILHGMINLLRKHGTSEMISDEKHYREYMLSRSLAHTRCQI
jgi:group I intron endonuclease